MNTSPFSLLRLALSAALAFALAGCPGESEPEKRERVTAPTSDAIARKTWLQPTEETDPDVWLASRDAGADVAANAPAAKEWHGVLDEADGRFGETGRMIANRAVQLETMLAEIGIRETAREIIADFSTLAGNGSRAGFSDLCQHYYNLRTQGLDRTAALAALADEPALKSGNSAP
ncbi:hypothetical protein EV667_2409 [Ancylobacter aquaticus]|uniref:MxaH protein n=1 Tax=Ancylobacter aquaticus TaxID=100 RepID=A0A4R1I421_ANCAQ|nr:hypothetical protein [Ancylobacter aquaticus]TCK28405.1 hypothetical protein EV667_2409 [Ancylobacter aquaticus]